MKVAFTLSNGIQITADVPNFNSEEFCHKLNNPQTLFISIGNNGFSKHTLVSWNEVPTEDQNA